jgi:translation initiation factor IF-2
MSQIVLFLDNYLIFWVNKHMNISTLAKLLGVSIGELREVGTKNGLYGFYGRNTRIPYNSAAEITKILRPEKLSKLKNDDRIYLPASIVVSEFAETIAKPVSLVLKTLMLSGVIATMNEKIDYDTAAIIADELGVEVHSEDGVFEENSGSSPSSTTNNQQMIRIVEYAGDESERKMILRPPVVTVMGHVDHGKTTLLDTIRKSNVAAGEAGAITQHISSYQIAFKPSDPSLQNLDVAKNSKGSYLVTFVDTPGHEAFTAMRARGSQLADFIILVVSAVEGPKPQTVEVIERAKIGKIPVIVALNKTDLPESDPERVKTEISKYGLVPEEWGGQTPFIPISAKTGDNLDKLLETILVHAELSELKGQVDCPGQAVVIESNLDHKLGVVTTALVVKDKIKVGDVIRCGETVSRIRKLESTEGVSIPEAVLGQPVIVVGLSSMVDVGEAIIAYSTAKAAQNDANTERLKRAQARRVFNVSGNTASENQINLVIVADVFGSLEALKESILKIPQDKVKIVIKKESLGQVTEGDLEFAVASSSTILAFHTDIPSKIEQQLKNRKINYVQSDIIYELIEWVEEQVLANTKHETKEIVLGKGKVLATFKSDKPSIQVFGCECIDGKIFSNKELKVMRGGEAVGKMEIIELQRNKVKAEEINISQQFGVSAKGKLKIQKDDEILCIDEVLVK